MQKTQRNLIDKSQIKKTKAAQKNVLEYEHKPAQQLGLLLTLNFL